MRIFSNFADIKAAVGSEIGVSDWVEITQDRIEGGTKPACVAELIALHYR